MILATETLKRSSSMPSRTASIVRCRTRRESSSSGSSTTRDGAGLLVDQQPPDPLEQPVHADDRGGVPRAALVERAGEHLVQPQGVRAVARRTSRRATTEFFRLLPIFPNSRVTGGVAVEEAAVPLDDLGRLDVEAPLVGERRGLDVALVEQPAERLGRAEVAEVEQDLVPEAARRAGAGRRARPRRRTGRPRRGRSGDCGPIQYRSTCGSTKASSLVGSR